jgi:integrase
VTSGREALSEPEVHQLFSKITNIEDECLLRLAVATGIRREDIVALELGRIDVSSDNVAWISYWESKKNRDWRVPVTGEALKTLLQHIDKLSKGTKWLFPSERKPGKHISGRYAYNSLHYWMRKAGIKRPDDKMPPFHALRATCVKLCQKRGWSVSQVMALTGDTWRTISEHYNTPTDEEMETVANEKSLM